MKSAALVLLLTMFFVAHACAGEPLQVAKRHKKSVSREKSRVETVEKPGDMVAVLSCFGYGYTAKVLINGRDTGIKGGKSESLRLFTQESEMAKEAPPEMRERYCILKEGENQIQVDFSKQGSANDTLSISLEIEGYPAPVFLLHSKSKASGKIEKSLIVTRRAPWSFKPVYVSDIEEGRSGFFHVSTMGVILTVTLNGQPLQTLAGLSGSIPLENIQPGKNELVISYQGDPTQVKELRFAIVTPQWTEFFSRTITGFSARTEKFTFGAK
jgi:hypothetical protein